MPSIGLEGFCLHSLAPSAGDAGTAPNHHHCSKGRHSMTRLSSLQIGVPENYTYVSRHTHFSLRTPFSFLALAINWHPGIFLLSVANNCCYSCAVIAIKHCNGGAQYIIPVLALDNRECCRYTTLPTVSPQTGKSNASVRHFTLKWTDKSSIVLQNTVETHYCAACTSARTSFSVPCGTIHNKCISKKWCTVSNGMHPSELGIRACQDLLQVIEERWDLCGEAPGSVMLKRYTMWKSHRQSHKE